MGRPVATFHCEAQGNPLYGYFVALSVGRGRKRRRTFNIPEELQGLSPRVLENGTVDLGIPREKLLHFLERLRRGEEGG